MMTVTVLVSMCRLILSVVALMTMGIAVFIHEQYRQLAFIWISAVAAGTVIIRLTFMF